jgi:catechol-2,3-dioxygenase
MSVELKHVVIDTRNAAQLAAFWSQVLERPVDDGATEYFATVGGSGDEPLRPRFMFIQVPEERVVKNRVHPDFHTADLAAEVDRLVAIGAVKVGEFDEYGTHWVTLADPEGNVFDVAG